MADAMMGAAMFSLSSAQRLYNSDTGGVKWVGGYKYGEIECWRGPAANLLYWTEAVQVTRTNDRPDLSSEGVPDVNKTVTVKQ
jgi:hypothetical protein